LPSKNVIIIGGGHIKPTEIFNLLLTLQGHKDRNVGEELIGIEEISIALQNYEPILNFKESKFPNVILIDISIDPKEAIRILKDAPTTVLSKAVPIETVVRTSIDGILEKVLKIASDKVKNSDKFVVRCDLRGRKYIEYKEELISAISEELTDKLNISTDEKNPDWIVQIEVVGENTGISVLKPNEIIKKI
jgi:tRNA acetyltransferase TAN1